MGVHARPRCPGYQPRHAAPPPPVFTLPDRARKVPPALAIAGLALTAPHLGAAWHVKQGDTLSAIAARVYGHAGDWGWLWQANKTVIANPNLIYPGEHLAVPAPPPPGWVPPLVPRPRTPAGTTAVTGRLAADRAQGAAGADIIQDAPAAGIYGCAGLESLWDTAGGNPSSAVLAASVAMAESGGNPDAVSPTDDYGLWQINGSHGPLATLNPYGNARAAVAISGDGSNWDPWTTYTSGAASGRC